MNPNLVLELVELAVELGQNQLESQDLTSTLLDIVHKVAQAYEEHTGETIDINLVGAEETL